MRMPKGLIEETKAIIRLYFFLRYEVGLREADRLSTKELRGVLGRLTIRQAKG